MIYRNQMFLERVCRDSGPNLRRKQTNADSLRKVIITRAFSAQRFLVLVYKSIN